MNWIKFIEDDSSTYPEEGVDVLVSDGKRHDVAWYIMSGDYKWLKDDVLNDDVNDFKDFIITKWSYINE